MEAFFQNAPVSFWLEDCTEVLRRLDELRQGGVTDFAAYFREHPETAVELASVTEVVAVNDAGLRLMEAETVDQLRGGLDNVFLPESFGAFTEELVALAGGAETFVTEAVHGTLKGGRRFVRLSLTLLPEKEGRRFGVVCMEDLTQTRALAAANAELEDARRFLSAVIDNIPDMVFVKEAKELRFVRFNRAGEALIGVRTADLQGKNDYDFFPASEADFFTSKDREVLRSGKILDIPKEPIDTPTGPRWLHTKKVPILSEQGVPEYLLGISEDITERLHAEEERQRLFEILELTPAIVGLARADGSVEYVNGTARSLHTDHELPTSIAGYHFHDGARLMQEVVLPHAVEHGAWRGELVWRGLGAVSMPTVAVVQAHRGHDGEVSAFSVVAHDIRDLKAAEEELERKAEALQRSNRDLQQFAYVASHDLQEPLRMVASFCQLLSEVYGDKLDDQGQEWLAFAVEGAQRMQVLIHDLLDFSRVGTRGRPFAPFSLQDCVESAMRDLASRVAETGAIVQASDLPAAYGDYAQVRQLLQNLLSNAMKFTGPETAPRIQVEVESAGAHWHVKVTDNGIGFDPKYAEKVFGLFKRLESRVTYPGTGIGLAICERIVQRHTGRIWVDTSPGEGSTFHFTLPKRPPEGSEVAV